MVVPDESHSLGLADFQREQEEEGFDRVESAVDEIACELEDEVRGENVMAGKTSVPMKR